MLSKKQAAVVMKDKVLLHRSPSADSSARARIAAGTHGAIKKCEPKWCEVEFDNGKGWLPVSAIWGVD
jgi:SH3-like domain-containing protein